MTQHSAIHIVLSDRLRSSTRHPHEAVDDKIMAAQPFNSVALYGRFLYVQHGFHRDVAPLYKTPAIVSLFPNLAQRQRVEAVEQDAADLGLELPAYAELPTTAISTQFGIPEALGWLYVVEGSNLGAAFLLKYAKQIGLSETYGARHLAAPPEGRAPNWRCFKEALDGVKFIEADVDRAILAAQAAFSRVHDLVRLHLS